MYVSLLVLVGAFHPNGAAAQNPCTEPRARALVLGSGGSKGAFQAGAAYHLIVHRGCDFAEISGNSVGALNGALLAQAAAGSDSAQSLETLRREAESLIEVWMSMDETRDFIRSRPLGILRVGLFGLESIKDTRPLQEFIRSRVALDRLAVGRELRVGTMSFDDGHYREVVINADGRVDSRTAHELILSSAIVPLVGDMPRIAEDPTQPPADQAQFGDGGIRHSTPVLSYFRGCSAGNGDAGRVASSCLPLTGANTPPHPRIEELFIIITSPYARQNDLRPVVDPKSFERGTRQITDGRKILVRMFDLLVDTMYREDLDEMLVLNDLLRWRAELNPTALPTTAFPIESYNYSDAAPELPSLPYRIAIVMPQREDTDPTTMFDLRPQIIGRQLYCGCLAADEMMQREFGVEALTDGCARRFPRPADKKNDPLADWESGVCVDALTAAPVSAPTTP